MEQVMRVGEGLGRNLETSRQIDSPSPLQYLPHHTPRARVYTGNTCSRAPLCCLVSVLTTSHVHFTSCYSEPFNEDVIFKIVWAKDIALQVPKLHIMSSDDLTNPSHFLLNPKRLQSSISWALQCGIVAFRYVFKNKLVW